MIELAMALLVTLSTSTNKSGQEYIRLTNKSEKITYHCEIASNNYYVDFVLKPKSQSRRYPKPDGKYTWNCF